MSQVREKSNKKWQTSVKKTQSCEKITYKTQISRKKS